MDAAIDFPFSVGQRLIVLPILSCFLVPLSCFFQPLLTAIRGNECCDKNNVLIFFLEVVEFSTSAETTFSRLRGFVQTGYKFRSLLIFRFYIQFPYKISLEWEILQIKTIGNIFSMKLRSLKQCFFITLNIWFSIHTVHISNLNRLMN